MTENYTKNNKINSISNSEEKIKTLLIEINNKEKLIKENWELYIRAKAETENIKKRTNKEIVNITKYSKKSILMDILPILDSLESCLSNKLYKHEKNYQGIKLLYRAFISMLDKYNVKKIETIKYSTPDPFKHEIISIIKNKEHDNKIMSVFQAGYTLYEKVIRYAKVSVLKKNND